MAIEWTEYADKGFNEPFRVNVLHENQLGWGTIEPQSQPVESAMFSAGTGMLYLTTGDERVRVNFGKHPVAKNTEPKSQLLLPNEQYFINIPAGMEFRLSVVLDDASLPVVLGPLTLSDPLQVGVAVNGNIGGATSGSILTENIPGVDIDSPLRSYSGTPIAAGLYQITETLAGATNSPRSTGVNVAPAAQPNVNITAISATKPEGNAGNTSFTFRITSSFATTAALAVNWTISGDVNGADFPGGVLPSGPTTLPAGQTTADVVIQVLGDTTVELDESFTVTLGVGTGYTVGSPSSANGIIQNDDAASAYQVSVESNGWVLAVRGTWADTNVGAGWVPHMSDADVDRPHATWQRSGVDQFPLTPNGTPKIVLQVSSPGFGRVSGQAVANPARPRSICATKVIRRPYSAGAAQQTIDETDHGDGTRTVRFALSQLIYANDVINVASFLSSWKVGEGAFTKGAGQVTNNSTRVCPPAISRWAQPSFELVSGTTNYTVEVIVAAHHPEHYGIELHQALAGMAITATDGVNTVGPFWASVGNSARGDNLRCWRATLDLTGLTAGPVTIHRTEYPWIGPSRSTGSAHSTDTTNSLPIGWASPHCISYDPAASLYPRRYVFVNAATGTSTAASVTVGTTHAAAKAGTAAIDVLTAIQALYLANTSLPARNGWVADSARSMDWHVITVASGTHNWGVAAVTSGANCNEGRLILRGDPDNANPKANCIVQSPPSAPGSKGAQRWWLENLTVEMGGFSFGGGGMWHLENVETRGKAGYETGNSTTAFSGTSPNGYANLSMCLSTWWKFDQQAAGSSHRFLLQRSCGTSRNAEAVVHINGYKPVDPYFPSRDSSSYAAFGTWGTYAFSNTDAMVWGCTAMDWAGRFMSCSGARSSGDGSDTNIDTFTRYAIVNSLCERSRGSSDQRIWSIGEGSVEQIQDSIFEGNTLHGNGVNGFYQGGGASKTISLSHIGNSLRNNVFGRTAIKQDIFKQLGSMTAAWEALFGVGYAGNVNGNMNDPGTAINFQYAWFGLNAYIDTSYAAQGSNALGFISDKSDYGPEATTGTGNGDYRPALGSPLIGRGSVASIDRYANGTVRGMTHSAGAMPSVGE